VRDFSDNIFNNQQGLEAVMEGSGVVVRMVMVVGDDNQ
jgi:hypothetical protein